MKYEQSQKEIIKILKNLSRKHGMYNAFQDFMTLGACTISNSVDKQQWQRREDLYMRTIKKYDKSEADDFAKMLSLVVVGLSSRLGDFLGELYMQLEISNDETGQFFTPYDVSKLMARLLDFKDEVITLNEPAVGSGGMIIAYAEAMKGREINFQKNLKVICNDIDYDVVKMCYIQLSLIGIDAVVMQGNTLTQNMTMNEHWYTPMHVFNRIEEQKEKDGIIKSQKIVEGMKKALSLEVKKEQKMGQLSLF